MRFEEFKDGDIVYSAGRVIKVTGEALNSPKDLNQDIFGKHAKYQISNGNKANYGISHAYDGWEFANAEQIEQLYKVFPEIRPRKWWQKWV